MDNNNITEINKNIRENINMSYFYIVIFILILLFFTYFAYVKYAKNSNGENFVNVQEQERSDYSIDFDLRKSIDELNVLQNKIMSNISEDINI